MWTLMLWALAHSRISWCGDGPAPAQPSHSANAASMAFLPQTLSPDANPFALNFGAVTLPPAARLAITGEDEFSTAEFKPRKHNLPRSVQTDYGWCDPMFRTTTVWQHLNQFRAQNRVRVLTLWEMGGSNLSLQAGRKGDPSLQWSSSWTNRSKVSSGLLDKLFAASLNGMANRYHASAHNFATAPATSPAPLITTAVPAAK